MTTQTIDNLSKSTVDRLTDLARINIDSAKGFEEAAEQVGDARLSLLFRELAGERREQADSLNEYVTYNDAEPAREGSYLAAFHRCWMKFRNGLAGDDSCSILSDAEYGEDQIKEAYEETLKETAGSAVNDVLMRQYADVKAAHDRIRDLRDVCRDAEK